MLLRSTNKSRRCDPPPPDPPPADPPDPDPPDPPPPDPPPADPPPDPPPADPPDPDPPDPPPPDPPPAPVPPAPAMAAAQPTTILLFSGKRKSGKDHVTDLLQRRLTSDACCVVRLSAPLKQQYAQDHNLDYEELLGSGQYKESYRADMIRWGEMKRQEDSGFFCRLAIKNAVQPVWIISDCRRLSDVLWFREEFPDKCICVRVEASEKTRSQRGWTFTAGIDDAESECGLDEGVKFDWTIRNDEDNGLEEQLQGLLKSLARD